MFSIPSNASQWHLAIYTMPLIIIINTMARHHSALPLRYIFSYFYCCCCCCGSFSATYCRMIFAFIFSWHRAYSHKHNCDRYEPHCNVTCHNIRQNILSNSNQRTKSTNLHNIRSKQDQKSLSKPLPYNM